MQDTHITYLLKQYFESETSLEDEQELKAYFIQDVVAEIHRPYKPLFDVLKAEKASKMPMGKHFFAKKSNNVVFYMRAASLVFMLAAGVFFLKSHLESSAQKTLVNRNLTDTYEDPEQAYLEVKAALALISQKMDKSKKSASKGLMKTKILPKVRSKLEQGN